MLALELEEHRILELMATGSPIRAHMARLDETAADLLVESFVTHYRTAREGLARAFPGMHRLLRHLSGRGIPVGVVTSKLREDALAELAATDLNNSVAVVVAFEDTDEHKPAPAPHREALRRVGAAGGLGVGDLPSDIVSAREAGLVAVGVAWGYGDTVALRQAGAERVCETTGELADALEEYVLNSDLR